MLCPECLRRQLLLVLVGRPRSRLRHGWGGIFEKLAVVAHNVLFWVHNSRVDSAPAVHYVLRTQRLARLRVGVLADSIDKVVVRAAEVLVGTLLAKQAVFTGTAEDIVVALVTFNAKAALVASLAP